jgi:hypothetical protein
MPYQVLDGDGRSLNAHVDLDASALTMHSRGGSRGGGNARNLDYGPALRLILERIIQAQLGFEGAWVDSSRVQALPISERMVLSPDELLAGAAEAFRQMSTRMKAIGHSGEGGNSTKRVRIQFYGEQVASRLATILGLQRVDRDFRSLDRLPVSELRKVTAEYIWNAVQRLRANPDSHDFGPSTDFDLVVGEGELLPPKAVFGVAAAEALGFEVRPRHFAGGLGTPCFRALEKAGFEIVPKGTGLSDADTFLSQDDREWAEGKSKLITHLKRERAKGLSQAKKDSFQRQHGRLYCERCGMDPVVVYGGEHGLACIEVHHSSTHVEDMDEVHRTRLSDLECLCANCHRIVHSLLKLSQEPKAAHPEGTVAAVS